MRGLPNASVSVTRCNHGITETDVYRFSNRFRNFHHHRHHLHRTWSLAPATAVHVEWSVASWRTSKADRFTSDVTGLCGTYYHAVDANPALEAQSRLREGMRPEQRIANVQHGQCSWSTENFTIVLATILLSLPVIVHPARLSPCLPADITKAANPPHCRRSSLQERC